MAGLAVQMGLGNMGVVAVWKAGVEWVGVEVMEVVGMKVGWVVEVQESARAVRNHSGKALAPLLRIVARNSRRSASPDSFTACANGSSASKGSSVARTKRHCARASSVVMH